MGQVVSINGMRELSETEKVNTNGGWIAETGIAIAGAWAVVQLFNGAVKAGEAIGDVIWG